MGRDTLLQQRKEKEAALKEIAEKYKDPASIKYDLYDDAGENAGYVEYSPNTDELTVSANRTVKIDGNVLKSLRDILNKLLEE